MPIVFCNQSNHKHALKVVYCGIVRIHGGLGKSNLDSVIFLTAFEN